MSKEPKWYVYQCPVCKDWQMDYSLQVMMEAYGEYRIEQGQVVPHMKPMYDVIDHVFTEHLIDEHPDEWANIRAKGVGAWN